MTALSHEYTATIEASPERVFAALTTPADLTQWFAEKIAIEAAPNGTFRFSGRGAYAPVSTRLTRFEPMKTLAFGYPIEGVDGEAKLTLTADDTKTDATKLTIEHALVATPAIPRAKELVDDLWRLAFSNLSCHLKDGVGVLLVDFGDSKPEVRLSIFIDASPENVFRGLVDPELLNKWVAKKAVVEPRVNGRYSFGWSHDENGKTVEGGPTKILELVENVKLVVDWPDWRGDSAVPVQRLTYLLAPEGKGTRLTLIHDGFIRPADVSDYSGGWLWFAERLKGVAES
ncbi:MAG: SRPBCC domain-containing protein [Labilithrix sp.]|nr:SRPBCC domain-containing protein [Labilithrix sp.]MBX3221324.1 SRPBCC domain-containing protein [Labilithrix sp.]